MRHQLCSHLPTQTLPQYRATRDLEELTPIGAKFSQLSGKRAIEMRINVATDFTSKGYEKDKGPGYQTKTLIHLNRMFPPRLKALIYSC